MLALGARGDDVIHLQDYLVQAGRDLAVDGIFGPITKGAVRAFQRTASIADDGIVGPQTWSHLKAGGYSIGPADEPGSAALATRIAARLDSIAAKLGPFASRDGSPLQSARSGGAEGADPATIEMQQSASEVFGMLGGLDPTLQSELGGTHGDLAAAVQDVLGGGNGGVPLAETLTALDTITVDVGEAAANAGGAAAGTGSTSVAVSEDLNYVIDAETIAGIGEQLETRMNIHGEAGHVVIIPVEKENSEGDIEEVIPNPVYETNKKGKVTKATVKLDLERVLPIWTKEKDSKCPCWVKEWKRYEAAISAHEQEHVNIYKRFFTGIHQKMIGKTENKADDVFFAALDAAEKAQETFDTTTEHGQVPKPGTTFDAGTACTC